MAGENGWSQLDEFRKNVTFYFSRMTDHPFAKPHWIFFSLSHRCTYRCRMCGVVKILHGHELPQERVKRCLDEIASWKNNPVVLFTGGEPFLRKDIFDILGYSVAGGLTTEVVSNGALIDRETAARITGSGLSNIAVSIDGAREETHDAIREKGSFRKALQALGFLAEEKRRLGKGPQLSAWVTIMKENVRELAQIIPLARDSGVECLVYHPVIVSQDDMQNTSPDAPFWLGKEEIGILREQIGRLCDYREQHGLVAFLHDPRLWTAYFENSLSKQDWNCNPYVFMNVGPDGDVRSCGEAFGNIGKMTLEQCLLSAEADAARKRMKQCGKPCLQTCWARPEADSLEMLTREFIGRIKNGEGRERMLAGAIELLNRYERLLAGPAAPGQ